jgi:hypothetical protein
LHPHAFVLVFMPEISLAPNVIQIPS